MKKLLLWTLTGLTVSLAAACDEDNTLGPDPEPFPGSNGQFSVQVDGDKEIYFDSKAKLRFRLTVESNKSWWVEKSDWVEAEIEDGAILLTATRNRSFNEREGEITVTDGDHKTSFPVHQQKGEVKIYKVNGTAGIGLRGIPVTAVSANGRYVMGSSSAGTWVLDLESFDGDEVLAEDVTFFSLLSCKCVTNSGEPTVWGSNYDGSLSVDFLTVSGWSTAYLYKNGQQIALDCPGEAQIGTITPHGGYEAYWVSEDGSYIAGKHIIARGGRTECGWRLNENTGHYDYIFYDKDVTISPDEWAVNFFTFDAMSLNGKYTAGRTHGQSTESRIYPYYRNLETGEHTVLRDYQGLSCSMITDEGIMSLAGQLGTSSIFDLNNPEAGVRSLTSWIGEVFGIDPADYKLESGLIRSRGINADRNTACWSYWPNGNPQALQWGMIITIE